MEENPKEAFNQTVDHVLEYVETQKQIVSLQATRHAGVVTGNAAAVLLVTFFLFMSYLLLNLAIVFLVNNRFNDLFASFMLVSGVNLLLALLAIVLRKTIIVRPVQNLIIRTITE
jgi:hypothetical protein